MNQEDIRANIDDYQNTVYAILAFMFLYKYDPKTKSIRSNVKLFQGRTLKPLAQADNSPELTPDIGVLVDDNNGVLGEVKNNLPREPDYWAQTIDQWKSYDQNLTGWPTASGMCSSHDIVLLLHNSRVRRFFRYFKQNYLENDFSLERPSAIVEYHRSDQAKTYVFLAYYLEYSGAVSDQAVDASLRDGVSVPLTNLLTTAGSIEFYDAPAPVPHVMRVLWESIVTRLAAEDEDFAHKKSNQLIPIETDISAVREELSAVYSFKQLAEGHAEQEPTVPSMKSVRQAFDIFVKAGDAHWLDESEGRVRFLFRKYDDVLTHCLNIYLEYAPIESSDQLKLFSSDKNEKP